MRVLRCRNRRRSKMLVETDRSFLILLLFIYIAHLLQIEFVPCHEGASEPKYESRYEHPLPDSPACQPAAQQHAQQCRDDDR